MLNLDLSQHNPIQSDSQYANVPLPSAHLVVIEESEMKESVKDGFTKGTNLLLELTILASSTGNEFVGEKLPLYVPISGFEETALKAGMKRLSTLAHTLGIGAFLANKEDLHGTHFIVVLEKQKNNNFANFKRILRADGMEIADASGNFKQCELKDTALQVELDKLLAVLQQNSGVQQAPQAQAPQQPPVATNAVSATQMQANPQNFVPQQFGQQQPTQPQVGGFGGQPQASQGGFGAQGGVPSAPQWGQAVNPQNGQ